MKKRSISLLLAIACLLSLLSFGEILPVKVQAAEGIPDIMLYEDYSSAKAFQISTPNGLKKFSELGQSRNFSGITFYLVADIDMSGVAYTPIPSFSGTLDGGYHVIERLSITTTNKNCGLFDTVSGSGIIRCLGMEGCVLNATGNSDSHRVGSFAGVLKGLVDQCWSSSVLTMTASGTETDLSAGGIAGALLNGGIVRNSFFAGRVTGVDHASGIADWCQGQYEGYVGQILNCFNIGTLSATDCYGLGRYSGKILEANKANAVKNSYYFDNYLDLSWTTQDQKVNKAWLGHGYLAYLMNQNVGSPIWSKGAMFPELRGGNGVYQLKVTYNTKGYTFTSNYYYNAGDTYTVKVPENVSVSLSSPAGSVNGRSYTMPAQNTTLTVTVDLPNVAQFTTYPNESVYVITDKAGFAAMATAVNGGKTFSGKTIYMICDINMDSNAHTPIGQFVSDSSWTKSFSGTFYGNRFRVFNLKVSNTSLNGGGLFGSCYKATFDGLQIFNGSVTTANRAGGITGYADGGCVFRYCSNGADIKTTTGSDGAGGLAGVARGGTRFEYCANYGTVTATVKAAAGIAGWGQTNIKLTGCINTGIITAGTDAAALARVGTGYTGTWTETYYLKSACATSVAGSSKDETNFSTGITGGSINTASRSKASNNAFTNTPRFPAICMDNFAPATCTRLYAHDNGISIGYLTVYGNVGDQVAMTNSQDYYGNPAHTLTAALTSYDYPEAVIYTITYHLGGGTLLQEAPKEYTYVTGAALPLVIQKDGYCFAGWYENSGLTGQVSATVGPNVRGDKTYYAKWSALVEIGTVAEYLNFVNAVNAGDNYSGKFVRITADLDFGGQTIPALGTAKAPFCGVLDGNGHKLSNFTVSGGDNQGLAGYLKQGTVQFLQIENATVSGKISTGTVVGYNDGGLVLGCESSGTVVNGSTIYDLSYMSFNIRCGEDPSPNTVSERTPRVKTYLANYQPDIIGLQEVTPTWKTVLGTALSGYSSEFKYRDSSGKEAAPLYWKTSKFNVMEKGTFWLSPTPDTMSLGWGASINRTCSYAVLQPKNTDIIILAYNTHLDHKSTQAQIEGIKLVKSRMDAMETKYRNKGYSAIYSFVTGDFNAKPTAEAGKYLAGTMVESRNNAVSLGTPVNQNTYSAYKETASQIIDYIYVSRNVDVKTYKVTLDKVNGQAVSDHYGLFGTMRLGGNAQGGIVGTNKGHIQTCGFTGTVDSKAGCGGIAGYNGGKIVGSYSKFAPKASDVFVNGIAPKVEGSVFFSYYPSGAGLSGSGSTTADMTSTAYLPTLNRLHSLWTMSASVNGGLPFICLKHEFVYKDNGDDTHVGSCALCGATATEPHSPVTDVAIAPTCTEEGKTQGSHCSVCNAVLVAQMPIAPTGHSYKEEIIASAGCVDTGLKRFTCENCNHSYGEEIPATGHTVVIDKAVASTCVSSGLTEGKHCSVCGTVLVAQETVARLGHEYTYADNGDGTHTGTCIRGDKTVTEDHKFQDGSCVCGAKEATEPTVDASIRINHTLNLASDISINFAVSTSALEAYDSYYLECTLPAYTGNTQTGTKTVKLAPVLTGNYYYFTLTGITAVEIGNTVDAVLHMTKDGEEYISATDSYSVATYAYSQMNRANMPQTLKNLCAELLRYGTKAQIFKGYRLDALVDANMTEEQRAFLTEVDSVTFGTNDTVLSDVENAPIRWEGKALDLASKVTVKFIFSMGTYTGDLADLTLRVRYEDIYGVTKTVTVENAEVYNADRGFYAFTLDALLACELRSVLSAQVYVGQTPVSCTFCYSADTYGNNKKGDLLELCKALFAYSDSAKIYFQ